MKSYQVGVIGFGWVAGAHIDALHATGRARVTAICSSRSLDENGLSQQYGHPVRAYHEVEAMLANPELDVISICGYPSQHADQAIAAAKAGKHLIIEKPVALSWADCQAVAKAVKDAGVRACVCFECRYSNQFVVTKSVLDQGLLGEVHFGEIDYYHGIGPWYGQFRWNTQKENGGSSLLSAGCHAMDALLLCMGDEVEAVVSFKTPSRHTDFAKYEYDTTSVSLLKFRDGRVGKVTSCIDALQPYYFHTHLVGSEGSLLDNKFHSNRLEGLNKGAWSQLSMKMLDSGDVSDHPYQSQFKAFIDALDEGKEMPLTSLREALRTHQVIFAADESAAKGGVSIPVGEALR